MRKERHLTEVLKVNGYPDHVIQAAAAPRREKPPEEKSKHIICWPHVPGVREDQRRICRRYGIRTVFTTISTFQQQLTRVKDVDPLLSRAGVVYRIPYGDCEKAYIGERELWEPTSRNTKDIPGGERPRSQRSQSTPEQNNTAPHGMRSPY